MSADQNSPAGVCHQGSPKRHDNALAFEEILRHLELATAEYNTVLAEVRGHQACIAKERAALGDLREQLIRMRGRVREWSSALWKLSWRDGVSHDACLRAELKTGELDRQIGAVIWQLFDFSKRTEEGRES